MTYQCQNFKPGQILTAECLNKIDQWLEYICGREITAVAVIDGELVFTFCNGNTFNAGKVTNEGEGGSSGLAFDGGYVKDGYLHLTLGSVDIEGFEPIKLDIGGSDTEIAEVIQTLSQSVEKLQQDINNIDTEGHTYYATYGKVISPSGEEVDNVFTLYEVTGDTEEVKSQFVITGGNGGGTVTNLVVERVTPSPFVLTPTDAAELKFSYSSTDSDGDTVDGVYVLKMDNRVVAQGDCVQGVNTIDISEFISIGSQKFTLTVTDDGGSVSVKSWTVQLVDVRLTSNFRDRVVYQAGETVSFSYTPYGSISKTVHFIFDGVELESVVTSVSGTMQSYTLPAQEHGAHLLECYITANINGVDIETDHIFKDIVWFDETSDVPVIGCIYRNDHYGNVSTRQYDAANILYHIFDPTTNNPTVTYSVDGNEISTQTLTASANTWAYKTDAVGQHTLVISCREASVTIVLDVVELGIEITPVTANLAFDFNPYGLSNSDTNRLWRDPNTGVNMSVSDNFDWLNGGYKIDEEGNQYFCVKAGTYATIHYNLFEKDASQQGAEFKFVFKTTNVRDVDATFLSCVSGATPVGLQMNAHAAYLKTSATGDAPLYMPYSEDDIIEFEYNINPLDEEDTDATAVIMSYEDGVGYRPMIYDAGHRLYQYTADVVPITIGSADCDVHIYRMKAYTSALTDTDVLSNFIADSRDSSTMLARYDRNQIYDENNALTPESVAAACPDLKIIKIDCPYFTQDKNEMIKNTSIECIHKGGDAILDNWKAINCYHSGQGTTSNEYGYAGRNLNVYMCFDGTYQHKRVTYDPDYITELTMGDGTKYTDGTGKVTLSRNSVPNALFNIKVNIASSENANNALLAKRYDRYLPYTPVSKRRDARAKTTMEFANCVVFIRENDPDLSTHREFGDTEWHFYAIGNIGDSKDTDQSRAYDPADHKEFVVEIADNTKPNSTFPSGVTDADGKPVYPINESQWVAGNPAYDSLVGNWDETFEFRYAHPDITDEEEAANIQVWNDFYKWIITATDEEFVAELKDWTIEEASLYMYLFTERYTMIDNRAKNTFWHYAKTYISQAEADAMGEAKAKLYTIDDAAAAIRNGYRFDFWDYDNDTALGINNSGEMTMTYGKEDVDYRTDGDPNSGYIYNAAESTFFCRIRDLMYDKLQAVYLSRESAGAWSASGSIAEFDAWQNQFPEELWRIDIERKYHRTYQGGTRRFLETMMNGRKRYHRRQWERDQEPYIGTKYVGATVKADQIMFRCNTPQTAVVAPNYDLKIVPYSDMYISVLYGNSSAPMRIRAKAGQEYEILNPLGNTMDDTAILIYCASRIQALNDLSGCYIHDNDFTKASKLQQLVIGNSTEGYSNSFLTALNIGNNTLLQLLNVKNCPNLTGSVNLTDCGDLVEFYADGTSITGVIFAPNGKIVTAYLPNSVNTISMRNLKYLTDLHANYDNLESFTEENSVVDELAIVQDAVDTLQTLRLTGIDWTLPNTALLNQILRMDNTMLSGKVYIESLKSSELDAYRDAWADLEISYASVIPQYLVTFVDWDGSILYKTHVDRGMNAVDPIAAELIETPTRESSVSTVYTFDSWDSSLNSIIQPTTITAVYSETPRQYTVRWFSQAGVVDEVQVVDYGADAVYSKGIPTHSTEEEEYFIYYLFEGWDKSTGFVDKDIDVYAIWQRGELPAAGTDIKNMNPAQIYAVVRNGKASEYFTLKDRVAITMGYNPDYTNIPFVDVANELKLDGATYVDTGIHLLKNGISDAWTVVADVTFDDTTADQTMLCCMQEDGYMGFKLKYSSGASVQWGANSYNSNSTTFREIMVIRHEAGSRNVKVYSSKAYTDAPEFKELTKAIDTQSDVTLILGANKTDAGVINNYAKGVIHSCRIWYGDLGDTDCLNIVRWSRKTYLFEVGGFGNYTLTTDAAQPTNVDFICASLLERELPMNADRTNTGGFDDMPLFSWLQNRLYQAFPEVWHQIMKQSNIKYVRYVDGTNGEIESANAYLWIPAAREILNTTTEPWVYEGEWVTFFTDAISRMKFRGIALPDGHSKFISDTDPATDPSNNVKEGDFWRSTSKWDPGNIRYNGKWVPSNAYYFRGSAITRNDSFGHIGGDGSDYTRGVTHTADDMGICPCFSI